MEVFLGTVVAVAMLLVMQMKTMLMKIVAMVGYCHRNSFLVTQPVTVTLQWVILERLSVTGKVLFLP